MLAVLAVLDRRALAWGLMLRVLLLLLLELELPAIQDDQVSWSLQILRLGCSAVH
jgi:hypothetical protein